MMMSVMYRGEFLSKNNVTWKVEILKDGFTGTVVLLDFPADSPLEIKWSETDKMTPVQPSSATLTVISNTDRQFVELYTIDVGDVRMDVYRGDSLYWSGCIDTELYEEPYSTESGYNVTLTFSDFACLDRLNWSGTGMMTTISDIIDECLDMSGISYEQIVRYISTSIPESDVPLDIADVHVLQSNFYDEEGSPMTAMEVLGAVLTPFALRVIQKGGCVYLYDLNALHAHAASSVVWDGTDATLGVDSVFNNAKVTFSPYADSNMMQGKVYEDETLTEESGGTLFRLDYHRGGHDYLPDSPVGFRIHTSDTLRSNMTKSNRAKYFQICPIFSGDASTGVIMSMRIGDRAISSGETSQAMNNPQDCGTIASGMDTETILSCPETFIGYNPGMSPSFMLRLRLSLLFDTRYNPFEQNGAYNEQGNWDRLQSWCNFAYVPIKLYVKDAAGNVLYHYHNYRIEASNDYGRSVGVLQGWVAGDASWGEAFLCYYDSDDRDGSSGLGGWKTNKPIIGYYKGTLPSSFKFMGDGEYIPLPPVGGFIVLEVGEGVHQFDDGRRVNDIFEYVRWVAYKDPEITLCNRYYKDAEYKDIEDSAWLNMHAREELSIDTVLGTTPELHGVPNAKGQLFDDACNIYTRFTRAGYTDRLERLLIGTCYSQYASRHVVLSGTVQLVPSFGVLGDDATEGKFIVLEEVQNCIEDTSEIVMAEFSADNYEGIEYE